MADNRPRMANGVREAWSILLLALCTLLFLSLFSYEWGDISILRVPPNNPPYNFIGPAGAWVSFVLLMALGVGAFVLPLWFLVFGIGLIFRGFEHIRAKLLWAALFMAALSGLVELYPDMWTPLCRQLNIGAVGGVPAQLITGWMEARVLGRMGVTILLSAMLLISIVMFFGMDAIHGAAARALAAGSAMLQAWRRHWADRQAGVRPDPFLEKQQAFKRKRLERILEKERTEAPAPATPSRAEEPSSLPAPPVERPLEKPLPAAAPVEEPIRVEPAPPSRREPAPRAAPRPHRHEPVVPGAYQLPPVTLLREVPPAQDRAIRGDTETTARVIVETLAEFGIKVEVRNIECGPVVTRYELLPAPGVRVEKIAGLSNNLALSLKATAVRVQAPIPGKGMVGVEVPNSRASVVYLREILEGEHWRPDQIDLPLCLGKDVGGNDLVADLAAMPHLLIAGTTGSGKTVCMNSILAGLLMSRRPERELQLVLIDPKIVEFSVYNGLPHLAGSQKKVITQPKKVIGALRWAITEMEHRYRILARAGVRNIQAYNRRPIERQTRLFDEGEGDEPASGLPERLPYIVIVVDELADLMLTASAEIENYIARLAQLSRAVGIHMILATQRPSVNVITGTIKANFPARIAFQVAQKVDSRTILDANGADKLLGRGDMLFLPPGSSKLVRAQGAMTTDEDIRRIVEFIRQQVPPPADALPEPAVEDAPKRPSPPPPDLAEPGPASDGDEEPSAPSSYDAMLEGGGENEAGEDGELIAAAMQIIRETRRASTSSLQRRLRIGYTRAARIMDVLEERGIVGPARGSDPREILIDLDGDMTENSGGIRPREEGGDNA